MNEREEEIEIDLLELITHVLRWWWLILLCGLATGAAAYAFCTFMLPKEYQSTTEIYILNSDNQGVSYSDLQASSVLTKDYAHLITTRDVLEQVIKELGMKESYDSLEDRILVETPRDTRIVSITVTDQYPAWAQAIADRVRIVASEHIKEVMAIDAVNVASVANLPEEPSGPNVKKYTMLGVMAGAFLSACIFVIHFLVDDTIKTSEDVERYLGLSILGLIPVMEGEEKPHSKKHKRRKKEKQIKKKAPEPETQVIDLDEEKEEA